MASTVEGVFGGDITCLCVCLWSMRRCVSVGFVNSMVYFLQIANWGKTMKVFTFFSFRKLKSKHKIASKTIIMHDAPEPRDGA